jgi:hypothetical protein
MTPEQTQISASINYLSGGLIIAPDTKAISDSATLGRKIGLDEADAAAYEQTLVGLGVIAPMAAYYKTPRYSITDAGRAYLIMAKSSTRAWTPDEILARIPERSIFAGNHLSIFLGCMVLVDQGLATTADGGGSFTLA